jgi:hypothetical protein
LTTPSKSVRNRPMKFCRITVFLTIILLPALTFADYRKGFNEGPYLRIIGGVSTVMFDNNARTGEKTSHDYEGAFGFQFGWNLWDHAAPELEVRYVTKRVRTSREHVFNINLNMKYSVITNGLTNIAGTLNIMPVLFAGPSVLLSAVPGDQLTNDALMTVWGIGFGGGAGVDFVFKRYISFGIIIQGDALYISPAYQTINGTRWKIINGGWEPQLGILGAAGVHF